MRCIEVCCACTSWRVMMHIDASDACMIWWQVLLRLFWGECACSGVCCVGGCCTGYILRCLLLDVTLAVHALMYIVGCCVECAWSDVCQVAEFAGCMCSDVRAQMYVRFLNVLDVCGQMYTVCPAAWVLRQGTHGG